MTMADANAIVPRRPAPDSLRHILISNSSCRLYIHPIMWTKQHLVLLRVLCLEPCTKSPDHHRSSCSRCAGRGQIDGRLLESCRFPFPPVYMTYERDVDLLNLLVSTVKSMEGSPGTMFEMNRLKPTLTFGNKKTVRLPQSVYVRDSRTSAPVLAFTNETWRGFCRQKRGFTRMDLRRQEKIDKESAPSLAAAQRRMKERMNEESSSAKVQEGMKIVEDIRPSDVAALIATAQEIARVDKTADPLLVSFSAPPTDDMAAKR